MQQFIDEETHSSLVLQILLSLNVRGAVIWIIANLAFVWSETPDWDDWVFTGKRNAIRYALIVFTSSLAALVECGRLYFGYSGNLREQVPDFAAFLILSVFFSLPSQLYLLYAKWYSEPMVSALYSVHLTIQSIVLVWLVAEILVGGHGIRRLAHVRAQQYHAEHFVKRR